LVVIIKEGKLESIMILGNISENSPKGQAYKKPLITTNSINNIGKEEEEELAVATVALPPVVIARNEAVKNVDQRYYLTAAFQKKQPSSHQL
jgi:hypothetical protein